MELLGPQGRHEVHRLVVTLVLCSFAAWIWQTGPEGKGLAGVLLGTVIHWWFPQTPRNGGGSQGAVDRDGPATAAPVEDGRVLGRGQGGER